MQPDSLLGHYRIIGPIGKGGMGEVYAAEDTKLHRRVAIKLLPRVMAEDPEWRRRFEREAQAIAALNHPNIVTIYSVEDADGVPFLTMELVDGRTLRDLIAPGGLPPRALLPVALGICDAITAAHQRGVTHRDLKPANVMVLPDGRVKVLDFGIAKVREAEHAGPEGERPTVLSAGHDLTGAGRIIGTAAYMSPEQAEGKPVDQRTDIFSLGVILHEMACGERPFGGDTDISIISSILKDTPPPITDINPALPTGLARIVRRCLAKEPDRRYQTAIDLRNDLEEVKDQVESAGPFTAPVDGRPPAATRQFPLAAVSLGALAVVAIVVAVVVWIARRPAAPQGGMVFNPDRVTRLTESGTASLAALSGDGRYVVHVKNQGPLIGLWMRQTATTRDVEIVKPALVRYDGLAFSPDGNYVYYVTYPQGQGVGTLYKVPVLGGPAMRIIEDIDSAPAFAPDGRMAFMRGDPVRGVTHLMVTGSDATGTRSLATASGDVRFSNETPSWSADGATILVTARISPLSVAVHAVDAATGRVQQVGQPFLAAAEVKWMPDGRSFLVDGLESLAMAAPQLWQVFYPSGERRRVTSDLSGYRGVSLSADGRLLSTVQSTTEANLWVTDANGREPRQLPISASRIMGVGGVAWMPDGRILFTAQSGGPSQIWQSAADGSNAQQLTNGRGAASAPAPSPDGRWIYYQVADDGVHIWRIDADGSNAKQLTRDKGEARPVVSPDGRWVYFTTAIQDQGKPMRMDPEGGAVTKLSDAPFGIFDVTSDGTQLVGNAWNAKKRRSECAVLPAGGGTAKLIEGLDGYVVVSCRALGNTEMSYLAIRDGRLNVFARPLAGGPERQLTNLTDQAAMFSGAASRDGRLLMSRGRTTSDIVLIGTDASAPK